MRRWSLIASAALAAAFAVLATAGEPDRPVVHEWGTFLVTQGSDGVTLDGMYHEEHALPAFVHSRGRDQLRVPHALVKGETPVIYFYARQPQQVHVAVKFPTGIWTQWYPNAARVGPHLAQAAPPDLRDGSIEWEAEIVPAGARPPAGFPATSAGSLWNHAREVDAAYVRTAGPAGPEVDRFLFYRGLGRAPLPLAFEDTAGGTLRLTGQDPVSHVFVLRVRDGRGSFRYLPGLRPGETLRDVLPTGRPQPLSAFTDSVADSLARRLVEAGLFEKEARAMVNTWRSSYFQTEGTRVLFVLPPNWTERAIPLTITPRPREVVRVMVGRLEVLDRARELRAENAVRRLVGGSVARRDQAFQLLREEGRYVEPIIRRVRNTTGDAALRRACDSLLLTDFVTDLRTALDAPAERPLADRRVHVRAQLALLLRQVGDEAAASRLGEEVLRELGPLPSVTSRRSGDRHPLRAAARASEATGDPIRTRAAYERYLTWSAQVRSVDTCRGCHIGVGGPTNMAWFRDWWAGRRYADLLADRGEAARELAALQGRAALTDSERLRLAFLLERTRDAKREAAWRDLDAPRTAAASR
jgi:hypothetical protein